MLLRRGRSLLLAGHRPALQVSTVGEETMHMTIPKRERLLKPEIAATRKELG